VGYPLDRRLLPGPAGRSGGYQDWKPAMWVLPSLRLSLGWRQVPFRALRVFHA